MNDLISRQAAIDAIGKASDELYENIKKGATFPQRQWFDGMAKAQSILENLPTADIDLSDYSDRLWRKAYERGKAVSKDALDEAYAHGYTAAEADFHKQNQWIPCDACKYNPPSAKDGKPCTMCPAEGMKAVRC